MARGRLILAKPVHEAATRVAHAIERCIFHRAAVARRILAKVLARWQGMIGVASADVKHEPRAVRALADRVPDTLAEL